MDSQEKARFNQEATDRLKKVFESSGIDTSSNEPPSPVEFLNAITTGAKELVELSMWRLEQEDIVSQIGHLRSEELNLFATAIEAIAIQIRKVAAERPGVF